MEAPSAQQKLSHSLLARVLHVHNKYLEYLLSILFVLASTLVVPLRLYNLFIPLETWRINDMWGFIEWLSGLCWCCNFVILPAGSCPLGRSGYLFPHPPLFLQLSELESRGGFRLLNITFTQHVKGRCNLVNRDLYSCVFVLAHLLCTWLFLPPLPCCGLKHARLNCDD